MNKNTYTSNLTKEDIEDAEKKYPLTDILKLVIPLLVITVIMFMLGIFIL